MAPKDVPDNYIPAEDEPFVNDRQRAYFRKKLLSWKNDILREARETLDHMQSYSSNHPDLADRASSETDRAIELRARVMTARCEHARSTRLNSPFAPLAASLHDPV